MTLSGCEANHGFIDKLTKNGFFNTFFRDSSNKHKFHQFWPRNVHFFVYYRVPLLISRSFFSSCNYVRLSTVNKITRALFRRVFIFNWCGTLVTIIVILRREKVIQPGPGFMAWFLFPFNIFTSTLRSATFLDRLLRLDHLERFPLNMAKLIWWCPEFNYDGFSNN